MGRIGDTLGSFEEGFLSNVGDYADRGKRKRLLRSPIIKGYLDMFRDWFSLDVKIEDVTTLSGKGGRKPGSAAYLIPSQITVEQVLSVFKKHCSEFSVLGTYKQVRPLRTRDGSYLVYKMPHDATFLEALIRDLSSYYRDGSFPTEKNLRWYGTGYGDQADVANWSQKVEISATKNSYHISFV